MSFTSPGVYVIEKDEGARPFEAASTSIAGFIGPTERGPLRPTMITSILEFEKKFGGHLDDSFMTYAIEGFFLNGGKKCYVARVVGNLREIKTSSTEIPITANDKIIFKANSPGVWGKNIYIRMSYSKDFGKPPTVEATDDESPENHEKRKYFSLDVFYDPKFDTKKENMISNKGEESYPTLSLDSSDSYYYKNKINGISSFILVSKDSISGEDIIIPATNYDKLIQFGIGEGVGESQDPPIDQESYKGDAYYDVDFQEKVFTGLEGLGRVSEISIMCAPDEAADRASGISGLLVAHCENSQDRFAIISSVEGDDRDLGKLPPEGPLVSKYAALYFPWIYVYDPIRRGNKMIPASGHVAGTYARVDINEGVHKAPANEYLRGVSLMQYDTNESEQGTLNPRGVNVIRRGGLIWGARTTTKDPLWKYINVRRLFIKIRKTLLDNSTWVVFKNNNESLWSSLKTSVSQYLYTEWRSGALMGKTPEEAFFVKCDRDTMTPADIANGKLIIKIGIAPSKPAEFVIFEISQITSEGLK